MVDRGCGWQEVIAKAKIASQKDRRIAGIVIDLSRCAETYRYASILGSVADAQSMPFA